MKIEWVAEIGSMHKGDKSLAFEMIRQFSQAGATTCKFQFGWTQATQEKHGLAFNPMRYAVDAWAFDLKKWCDLFGVKLLASIWSKEGLIVARALETNWYKISSQVWCEDQELAVEILAEDKLTFVSGDPKGAVNAFPIYCISQYPVYPDKLTLPAEFDDWYGYSDHTHGIEACLLAVARGAWYIEKHVCLGKDDLTFRDTPFAATPDEFAQMVKIGNGMRRLLDAQA